MADLFGNLAATPRPNKIGKPEYERVARKLLPDLILWLQDGNGYHNDDDYIVEQLVEAIEDSRFYSFDAFHIVNYLKERKYWECDTSLVELVEPIHSMLYEEQAENVRLWVKANNIEAPFGKGVKVRFTQRGKQLEGTITKVEEKSAQYLVNCPELGHLPPSPESEKGFRTGTLGTYVPFEDCTAV